MPSPLLKSLLDRYLPARYRALFTDEFTLHDNPIFLREARRDSRRRDRVLLLFFSLATPCAFLAAVIWLLTWFAGRHGLRRGIPIDVGGSYGSLMFIVFTVVHFWFVLYTIYRRTFLFFLTEYRQNSLASLLCTRINPFQLVLQASVYPFCQAMLVALAGLPFYLYFLSIGGATVTDVLGLYLIFVLIAFKPPRWSVPAFAGLTADDILKRQRGGRPKTWGEFWLGNGAWGLMLANWYLAWAFGNGWVGKVFYPLWFTVPKALRDMSLPFPLTWVVLVERFLFTPLPYYRFLVPPILVVIPIYLLARLLAVWESSIHLRSGDTDWGSQMWDLQQYWRLRRIYGLAMPFLLLGFLWKPYVEDGLTSVLVAIKGSKGDLAVAGLYLLAGSLAALVMWARVREASAYRHGAMRDDLTGGDWMRAGRSLAWEMRYVLSPVLAIYGMVVLACLLAGRWPFPLAVVRLIGPMLIVTFTGALWIRALPQDKRVYLLVLFAPFVGWAIPIPIVAGAAAAISPLMGLLSLTPHTQRILNEFPIWHPAALPWQVSVLITAALGVAGNIWADRRAPRTAFTVELPPALTPFPTAVSQPSPEIAAAAVSVAPPPVMMPSSPEHSEQEMAPRISAGKQKRDTRAALQFIEGVQRWMDNAVATREMRVSLRGHMGPDEQLAFGLLLGALLLIVLYRHDVTADVLRSPAQVFFGGIEGISAIFAGLIVCQMAVLSFIVMIAGATVCGAAFSRERDKSTLGFMLVTPLPTMSIVVGKFLGLLAPLLITVGVFTGWHLLLSLPLVWDVRLGELLIFVILFVTAPVLITLLSGSFGLFWSTVFRRESDAAGLAFLGVLVIVIGDFIVTGLAYGTPWTPAIFTDFPRLIVWYGVLLLSVIILCPLALRLTVWRLNRARQGDIAFESAKVQA